MLYCTLWQVSLTSALVTDPSRVVIVTDWGHGAGTNIFHYWQAKANTRYAGVTYTLYCTVLYCTILYTPGTWVDFIYTLYYTVLYTVLYTVHSR